MTPMGKIRTAPATAIVLPLLSLALSSCSEDPAPTAAPTPANSPSALPTTGSVTEKPSPEDRTSRDPVEGVINGFTHGARYYGVYVFIGRPDDPGFDGSIERLQEMGLKRGTNFSDGDLGCDDGAMEGLGLSDEEARGALAVAVYFEKETDAHAFAASLEPPPEGVARVRTLCAD